MHKSKPTYTSVVGGIVSLMSVIGIFIWFVILLRQTINRDKYTVVNSIVRKDLNLLKDNLTLTVDKFDIGFSPFVFTRNFNSSILDRIEEHFIFSMDTLDVQFLNDLDERKKYNAEALFIPTRVPMVKCDETRFLNMTSTAKQLGLTGKYLCPEKNFSFTLSGTWSSSKLNLLLIKGSICADLQEQ
jgi:hypothetical protein